MEKWIQKAVKKPGALRKSLGVKAGEKIPAKKLASAAKKPGVIGKRARLAETLKSFGKGKRMAGGGYTGPAGTNQGAWSGAGGSLGVRTGTTTGTTASNVPRGGRATSGMDAPVMKKPTKTATKPGIRPSGYKPDAQDLASANWSGSRLDITGVPGGHGVPGYGVGVPRGPNRMRAGGIAKHGRNFSRKAK